MGKVVDVDPVGNYVDFGLLTYLLMNIVFVFFGHGDKVSGFFPKVGFPIFDFEDVGIE